MSQNLISLSVSAEQLAAINATLDTLEAQLAGLIELSVDNRRRLVKMGDKSEAFCRQTLIVLDQNRQMIPPSLDLARVEAGQMAIRSAPEDVAEMVGQVCANYQPVAQAKGVTLECEAPVGVTLACDRTRVVQVLNNLVHNALKFTEQGGVLVAACMESEDEQSRQLHLTITDTGIGIPESMLTKIFEPFVQVDPVLTRRYGGTGLGMSIASQIVGLFQGRIWAESAHGGGSCFHILLCTDLPVKGEL